MSQNIAIDAATGAIAGAIATAALSGVTSVLYTHEDRSPRRQEDRARGGKSTYVIAADKAADLVGYHLTSDQEELAGTAVHYGIGVGSGALYASVRRHVPAPAIVKGLGLGAVLWLVADEGANPALGLTPGPAAFPWQTHARGLAAHLVFGLVAEGVLSLADRFLPARP